MLNELNQFIPVAEKVFNKKSTLSALSNVCINNGEIYITDLENTLVLPINTNVNCLLSFDILKKVLKQKPNNLGLLLNDDKVVVDYDGKNVSARLLDIEEYPSLPKGEFKVAGNWSKDVIKIMNKQLDYTSNDELKPALMGMHVVQNDSITSCATNGHRLRKYYHLEKENSFIVDKFDGIISAKAIKILEKMTDESLIVSVTREVGESKRIHYFKFHSANGFDLYTRAVDENYPDEDSVIPKEVSFNVVFDRKELMNLAKESCDFINKTTYQGVMEFIDNEILLHGKDCEQEIEFNGKTENFGDKPDFKIAFNMKYLSEILKTCETDRVNLGLKSPINAALFTEIPNGIMDSIPENVMLLMPIRLPNKGDEE